MAAQQIPDIKQFGALLDEVAPVNEDEQKSMLDGNRGYIDFPRIHFYGKFRANVGTGNNVIPSYRQGGLQDKDGYEKWYKTLRDEAAKAQKDKDKSKQAQKVEGLAGQMWNPSGDMTFSFVDCNITEAYDVNGKPNAAEFDNYMVNPSICGISGRLTDLDVNVQHVSRIFGFKINICDENDNNNVLLSGNYEPASFRNIWLPDPSQSGDAVLGATWMSVLTDCQFFENSDKKDKSELGKKYPILSEFARYAAHNGNKLQIKFVVSNWQANFTSGTCFGVIGCYTKSHPTKSLLNARYLFGVDPFIGLSSPFYYKFTGNSDPTNDPLIDNPAPAGKSLGVMTSHDAIAYFPVIIKYVKKDKRLLIDLSNYLMFSSEMDPKAKLKNSFHIRKNRDFGNIEIKINDKVVYTIKPEEYQEMDKFRKNCGFFFKDGIELEDEASAKFSVTCTYDNKPMRSEELLDGYYITSEDLQIRLGTNGSYGAFGTSFKLPLFITKYGVPQTGIINGLTIHSLQYRRDWDDTPAWVEPPCEYDPTLGAAIPVKDVPGLYEVEIQAPKTLFYSNGPRTFKFRGKDITIPLPRWHYFLDSFPWGLYAIYDSTVVASSNNSNANADTTAAAACLKLQKEKQLKINNAHIDGTPHGKMYLKKALKAAKGGGDANAANADSGASSATSATEMNFFIAGLLIFNEMDPKDLPPIITWQHDVAAAETKENWEEQLKRQPHHPSVHPIFRQYANMFPVMRPIVDLDSYASVTANLEALIRAYDAPWDSPQYMPVTRDMSGQTRAIIKSWLRNPIYCDSFVDPLSMTGGFKGEIRDIDTLRRYLQCAIELELSTLPPYLTALYSMVPNDNTNMEIKKLIRSIAIEEMSHLALACNLLLSIKGGQPKIAYKEVIARCSFPRTGLASVMSDDKDDSNKGKISVLPDLLLELKPMQVKSPTDFSVPSTIDAFLKIEAPADYTIDDPDKEDKKTDDDSGTDAAAKPHVETLFHQFDVSVTNPNKRSLRVFAKLPLQSISDSNKVTIATDKNIRFKFLKLNFKTNPVPGVNSNVTNLSAVNDAVTTNADNNGGDPTVHPTGHANKTIGAFYELIRKGFYYLNNQLGHEGLFNSKAYCVDKQVSPTVMEGLNYVYNLNSALKAIDTIVSEGEGTSMTDIWSNGEELSHFHKFLQIKVGHPIVEVRRIENDKLKKDESEFPYEYIFSKTVDIDFNQDGVTSGSEAWDWLKKGGDNKKYVDDTRVKQFNSIYGKLLTLLQDVFGGNGNDDSFKQAIPLMRQLQVNFNRCLRPEYLADSNKLYNRSIAPNWIPPDSMLL